LSYCVVEIDFKFYLLQIILFFHKKLDDLNEFTASFEAGFLVHSVAEAPFPPKIMQLILKKKQRL
jgi:hypothetical protein